VFDGNILPDGTVEVTNKFSLLILNFSLITVFHAMKKKLKYVTKWRNKPVLIIVIFAQQGPELRLPLGQGIAGHVASTGKHCWSLGVIR
jgi:hypothetical protein